MRKRPSGFRQLTRNSLVESLELRRVLAANPLQGMLASDSSFDSDPAHGHGAGCGCSACGQAWEVSGSLQGEGESGWSPGSPVTITERVTIQPIIVSNDDGSSTAKYFGNQSQQDTIHGLIDEVWAQAGIDIDWLEPNYWNNTEANFGNGSPTQTRSSWDLNSIVSNGDAGGYGNANPLVLDMYFVEIAAGFKQLSNNHVNGLAFVGGNGSTVHVGDNTPGSSAGREVVARVVAHEIGHNLGLSHVSINDNLMQQGEQLNSSQISTAIASRFSVPLTNNQTPVVVQPIGDLVVNENAANTQINLSPVFSDPDGDSLSYSVNVAGGAPLTASISGQTLVLDYLENQSGTTTVTVRAQDPFGASITDAFQVTVNAATPSSTDWGVVDYRTVADELIDGASWFQMEASQDGTLSVLAEYNAGAGNLQIELYDAGLTKLAEDATAGSQRVDAAVSAGATYFLKASGTATVNFHVANMLRLNGSTAQVTGTAQDDAFTVQASGGQSLLTVGALMYPIPVSFTTIQIDGRGGLDSLQILGSAAAEQATLRAGSLTFTGSGITLNATAEVSSVTSGGGADAVTFEDSAGDDRLNASPTSSVMQGTGYSSTAIGFASVTAISTSGSDEASLFDSAGNDSFTADPAEAVLRSQSGSYSIRANGFDKVFAFALEGGNDVASLTDGPSVDHFATYPEYAFLYSLSGEFFNYTRGFDTVSAVASSGTDVVIYNDGATNDTLEMSPNNGRMYSQNGSWDYRANGFAKIYAYATAGGTDSASLTDSPDDDVFYGTYQHSFMQNDTFVSYANGFENVVGYSTAGGADRSFLYDSPANDLLTAGPETVNLRSGSGSYSIDAHDFGQVFVTASTGTDTATFLDSAGNDQFVAHPGNAYMVGPNGAYLNSAVGFDGYAGTSTAGNDVAIFHDGSGNDVLELSPQQGSMVGPGYNNSATGFSQVLGYSQAGGADSVIFRDSPGQDTFTASPESSSMQSAGYQNAASGFASVVAHSTAGGNDSASLFDSSGNDSATVRQSYTRLSAASFSYTVHGFPVVYATSSRGGVDTLDKVAVDYLFQEFGDWQ